MAKYIVRRLLWTPFLLLMVGFITYVLGYYGPGDPVEVLLDQYQDPVVVERIREQRGLDKPVILQYGIYIKNALGGDLGESFKYRGQSVSELLGGRIWVSVQLGLAALILGFVLGIPLGLFAAVKQGQWQDTAVISGTLLFYSLPVFITAPFLLLVFVLWLGILPSQGWGGLLDPRIIMPMLILGIPGVAAIARMSRNSIVEVLAQDYVRTARSKGLPEYLVYWRHVLRNAMIPVFTLLGLSLATLVTGAFITETLFGIPGVGRLAIESFFARDYPVITALTLVIAGAYVMANLLVDIFYKFLDPRVKYD
ncbi:MAG: ABC transporter permease [Dehalococcoidales bacterium]|nr:ABC transporter permease [Dehalococcoidales bacterium]